MVIQGPNLNMLGIREQQIYGPMKLEEIHTQMKAFADANGIEIEFFQSNLEGELVDKIQQSSVRCQMKPAAGIEQGGGG